MVPTGIANQSESHVSQARNVTSQKPQTKWEAVGMCPNPNTVFGKVIMCTTATIKGINMIYEIYEKNIFQRFQGAVINMRDIEIT